MRVGGHRHAIVAIPWERLGTHRTGDRVSPRASLDERRESRLPHPAPPGIRNFTAYYQAMISPLLVL